MRRSRGRSNRFRISAKIKVIFCYLISKDSWGKCVSIFPIYLVLQHMGRVSSNKVESYLYRFG